MGVFVADAHHLVAVRDFPVVPDRLEEVRLYVRKYVRKNLMKKFKLTRLPTGSPTGVMQGTWTLKTHLLT